MTATAATMPSLLPAHREFLLRSGRRMMEAAVQHEPFPERARCDETLLHPGGAFVTLSAGGELRGCMGYPDPRYPLVETVERAAVRSALEDRRFPPVHPAELHGIRMEISVLSGREPVGSLSEVSIGVHGLYLDAGALQGILLPQVAAEQGWDPETFLARLFGKCGLPPSRFGSTGVALYRFTADVFARDAEPAAREDRRP